MAFGWAGIKHFQKKYTLNKLLLGGVSKTPTLDVKNSNSLVVSHPKTLDALDVSNTQTQTQIFRRMFASD